MKMSKNRVGNLKSIKLFASFLTSRRLGARYDLLAFIFCKRCRVCSLRQFVVAAGVLDIRTVSSVNDLDVAVFVLGDDAAGFL